MIPQSPILFPLKDKFLFPHRLFDLSEKNFNFYRVNLFPHLAYIYMAEVGEYVEFDS